MKKTLTNAKRIAAIIALLGAVCLLFASCSVPIDENGTLYQNSTKMIDAILADDAEAAYSIVSSAVSKEDFEQNYPNMKKAFEGVGEYTISCDKISKGVDNGYSYNRAVLRMEADTGEFLISVQEIAGYEGLVSFYIQPASESGASAGSSPMWITLCAIIISAIELGFVIYAFIDCVRHCKRSRVLWAILILLGRVAVGFTLAGGSTKLSFTLMIGVTTFLATTSGGIKLSFMVPVAAIVWMFLRNKMCTVDPNVIPKSELKDGDLDCDEGEKSDSETADNG